jgi:hypothetical protein
MGNGVEHPDTKIAWDAGGKRMENCACGTRVFLAGEGEIRKTPKQPTVRRRIVKAFFLPLA